MCRCVVLAAFPTLGERSYWGRADCPQGLPCLPGCKDGPTPPSQPCDSSHPSLSSSETRAWGSTCRDRIEGFHGTPLRPKKRWQKEKSKPETQPVVSWGKPQKSQFGMAKPTVPPHKAQPRRTLAAKTRVGTRLHWQHLGAISCPVQQ